MNPSRPSRRLDASLPRSSPRSLPGSLATIAATLVAGAALLVGCTGGVDGSSDSPGGGGGGNVGFGGAQDLGQFRDIIERGELPAPSTLDANGFFAEHYVDLPPPSCGKTLCVHPMVARGRDWLTRDQGSTLQLALTTPLDPASLPLRPLDLVVIVDRSGSMVEDDRLGKVKRGLGLLIDQLRPTDRLALVSFHDSATTDVGFTTDRAVLRAAAHALSPGGGTNLHGGLARGLGLARAALSLERESRVLLLSDGLATAGVTDPAAIIDLATSFVRDGVGLSTIGVGHSFDVTLMRQLAERGAGNFYFLEDAAAVDEVFTQELTTSMTPIALDLKLTVIAASGVRIGGATGRAGFTHDGRRGELRVPAAFAVSRQGAPGEGRRGGGGALFIALEDSGLAPGELARVELTYRLPSGLQETQSAAVAALGAPDDDSDVPAVSHQAMLKHAAMYQLYRGLHAATERTRQSSHCTIPTLRQLEAVASAWNLAFDDDDLAADLLLVQKLTANLRAAGFPELAETSLGQCLDDERLGLAPPIGAPYPDDPSYDDHAHHGMMCAAGGADPTALSPLGLALLTVLARRRRRAAS